jgi:hypothetical protein
MEGESVYADVDAGKVTSHKLFEEPDCLVLFGDDRVCGRTPGNVSEGSAI